MKKLYIALFASLLSIALNAQVTFTGPVNVPITKSLPAKAPDFTLRTNFAAATCSPVNLPVATEWGAPAVYLLDQDNVIDTGFVTGTNKLITYAGLGQYFDQSTTSYNYLTGVYISFSHASSLNLNTAVPVEVYEGTAGGPGGLIGSYTLTMKDIMRDVNKGAYTIVRFNPALVLPVSKMFFVTVNMQNLRWSAQDSLAIASSQKAAATDAWVRYYTSQTSTEWSPFNKLFSDFDAGLYIFPFVSENQSCDVMPVNITSFTAQAKGKDAILNWQVAQEINMKQYAVERSATGRQFITTGSVAAANTTVPHAYTFTDVNALSQGTTQYYRLRQEDKDGAVTYSKIIPVLTAGAGISIRVVNPFKNTVQLQVNAPTAQTMQGAIYDALGHKVSAVSTRTLAAGQNSINIPTSNLPKGVYILNVTVGKTNFAYKIIN